MALESRFPLILWEETEEYQTIVEEARKSFNAGPMADIHLDENCIPTIWRIRSVPYHTRTNNPDIATQLARQHGTYGYFRAEDFDHFRRGQGYIFEEAMHKLGFRPHKRLAGKWSKMKKGEKVESPGTELWKILHETRTINLDLEERFRLMDLITTDSEPINMGQTFSVTVGQTGLIYAHMDVNPFAGNKAEHIGILAAQLAARGHINRDQEGFSIQARNIMIHSDINSKVVHILAQRDGQTLTEAVWPSRTNSEKLVELAADLKKVAQAA